MNLAARMEAYSGAMEITLCDDMYELVQKGFRFTEKDAVETMGPWGVKS